MTTYTTNLYDRIIVSHAKVSSRLKVISGYASSTFLKRVIEEFPSLKIDLYIGMTHQGVSKKDHEMYCEWTRDNGQVKVYYQTTLIPNHMKILMFEVGALKRIFLGSANFSENGFLYQQEIMTEVETNLDALYIQQHANSIICIHPQVDKYVTFFEVDYVSQAFGEQEILERIEEIKLDEDEQNLQQYLQFKSTLEASTTNSFSKDFSIEVVLPKSGNPHWASNGVNAWRQNKQPHLLQTNKVKFNNYFPSEQMFDIYADDGVKLKAKVTGKFNSRQLSVENVNLYEYVCKRIGLNNGAPISYENLLAYGRTNMVFNRIDNKTYIMNFRVEN